jgi:serine phosphatase RsbU (regulator of sigma subunit)
MDQLLQPLFDKLYPDLRRLPPMRQQAMRFNLSTVVLLAPINLLALAWLIWLTDTTVLRQQAWFLLLHLACLVLLRRFTFTLRFELRRGFFVTSGGALDLLILFAAGLLIGPSALWLSVIAAVGTFLYTEWQTNRHSQQRQRGPTDRRWARLPALTVLVMALSYGLLGALAALWSYEQLGGRYPLADLSWDYLGPALAAVVVAYAVPVILSQPRVRQLGKLGSGPARISDMVWFSLASSALSALQYPFGILAAAIWSQQGLGWYLFFLAGVWLAGVMANRLSQSVARSEQRGRELARLEQLGQAIIAAPPDASTLPELVSQHIEGMLPGSYQLIWLEPETVLLRSEISETTESWASLKARLPERDVHQWASGRQRRSDCLLVAIRNDHRALLGGIFVQLNVNQTEDTANFLPAMQSLAGQIASAVQRAQAYQQALAHERLEQELRMAGEIQASFLPQELPQVSGWQIAASLHPARQTSGDFYDFIDLGDGRLAFLVADVADKGIGAALFMALSRTLLRTYARHFPGEPARVLQETNARILTDTQSDQFVTLFYGVLETATGCLTYASAGHNPALLVNHALQKLGNTGMPLGIFPEITWAEKRLELAAGDALILYTDGISEAANARQEEFGDTRLSRLALASTGQSAAQLQTEIEAAVTSFTAGAPQTDDMTLLIIRRDSAPLG